MDSCSFAVVPDDTGRPAALFVDLEEAISWGLEKYGDDRFAIRYVSMVEAQSDDRQKLAS